MPVCTAKRPSVGAGAWSTRCKASGHGTPRCSYEDPAVEHSVVDSAGGGAPRCPWQRRGELPVRAHGVGDPRGDEPRDQRRLREPLTPAPYAFSIWGVVYASFVTFCVASLLPSQRKHRVYDRLAGPLVGMNVLASVWLMAFHAHSLVLSFALILLFVVVAADAFLVAHEAVAREEIPFFFTGPFSIVFGWICVATIANGSVLLVSLSVPAFTESAEVATMAMIGAAAVTAALVSARFNDFVFPSAVGWATVGIVLARRTDAPNVAIAALVGTLLCAHPLRWGRPSSGSNRTRGLPPSSPRVRVPCARPSGTRSGPHTHHSNRAIRGCEAERLSLRLKGTPCARCP